MTQKLLKFLLRDYKKALESDLGFLPSPYDGRLNILNDENNLVISVQPAIWCIRYYQHNMEFRTNDIDYTMSVKSCHYNNNDNHKCAHGFIGLDPYNNYYGNDYLKDFICYMEDQFNQSLFDKLPKKLHDFLNKS